MPSPTISKRTWAAIYRLLDRVSPVPFDCGSICGSACCGKEKDALDPNLGIYLYPGEEQLFSGDEDWLIWERFDAQEEGFPPSWQGEVAFVKCIHPPHCPRPLRPLQCRTFPLAPDISEDGNLALVWNTEELPYCCPLIEEGMELDPRFVQATYTVWRRLIENPAIRDLVEEDSEERRME